jgi:hypothetical protein
LANMGRTDARPIGETKEWQNIVRLATLFR